MKKNEAIPISESPKIEENGKLTRKGVYASISYMSCAVLLIMFNKAALSSYKFPYVNVITLFQLICSSLFLYVLRGWKIISFREGESTTRTGRNPVTLVPLKTLVQTLPLSLSYLLFMLVSMESVRGISVPMYTTLRRTTVAFTMVVEYLMAGQKYSHRVVGRFGSIIMFVSFPRLYGVSRVLDVRPKQAKKHLHIGCISVAIIVLGAFVAGARDLSFDLYSYAIVLVSNVCTAVYLASISRLGKSTGLTSFGLMWCNGMICGPILLIWTFFQGDLKMLMSFHNLYFPGFQAVMLLSCIMAFLLNYTVFWNTALNSALAQTICGNLKDIFTIGLGWLIFGGLPFDWLNIVGQGLGFLGSCLYAYCRLKGK